MKNIDYIELGDIEKKIDEFYDIDEKEAIKLYQMLDRLKEFMEEGE